MHIWSDAVFCQKFFAQIDLSREDMTPVRHLLDAKKWREALEMWKKTCLDRVQTLSKKEFYQPVYGWLNISGRNPNALLGDNIILTHGWDTEMGKLGDVPFPPKPGVPEDVFNTLKEYNYPSLRWYRPDKYDMHAHLLWNPGILIRESEKTNNLNYQKNASKRWAEIWCDFSNNCWRLGMAIKKDKPVRDAILKYYGLKDAVKQKDPWVNDIFWRQTLLVCWQSQNFMKQFHHGMANIPEGFRAGVDARDLAETVYFMVVWNLDTAAGNLGKGAANQRITNTMCLLDASQMFPEFKRISQIHAALHADISSLLGVDGVITSSTDLGLDGAGSELSYNYMFGTTGDYSKFLDYANRVQDDYPWKKFLAERLFMRQMFQRNVATPTGGSLIIGKSEYKQFKSAFPYVNQLPPKKYTSIAFPYHGLYIMRSDWTQNALWMAFFSPRRGGGHEAEDANKIVMEAYGKPILVTSPGENGYFGSSWAQNTVNVDSSGQCRRVLNRHGIYDSPRDGLWFTSDLFDFAEGTYSQGYGLTLNRKKPVAITDITHLRQVIFIKEAKLWVILDRIKAPENSSHSYTQCWHFHENYSKENFNLSAENQHIITSQPKHPNMAIFHAGIPVTYSLHYGEGWEIPSNARPESVLSSVPENAAGWVNIASGYTGNGIRPAPEVRATFSGKGPLTLCSVLAPSPDEKTIIKSVTHKCVNNIHSLSITCADDKIITLRYNTTQIYVRCGDAELQVSDSKKSVRQIISGKKTAEMGVPSRFYWTSDEKIEERIPMYK